MRFNAAFERFRQALSSVPRSGLEAAGAAGSWSARDVVAHVGSDLRWFTAQLEAAKRGDPPTATECYGDETPPPPQLDFTTVDGRNAWHHERNRALSFEQAEQRLLDWHERARRALEGLDDADFGASYTIAGLDHVGHVRPAADGEQGWPLSVWVAGSTWRHYEEHARDLEVMADREG